MSIYIYIYILLDHTSCKHRAILKKKEIECLYYVCMYKLAENKRNNNTLLILFSTNFMIKNLTSFKSIVIIRLMVVCMCDLHVKFICVHINKYINKKKV